MQTWFKVCDSDEFQRIAIVLTDRYGYPWSGTNEVWYYSYNNVRNGVNNTIVYVQTSEEGSFLTNLGFKIH